jgi:hypothetical protein
MADQKGCLSKVNTTSLPVAEAEIVATVGALLLSIMVPVAETAPEAMLKFSVTSSIASAVVGTEVPVVAPQNKYINVCGVIRTPAVPLVNTKYSNGLIRRGC